MTVEERKDLLETLDAHIEREIKRAFEKKELNDFIKKGFERDDKPIEIEEFDLGNEPEYIEYPKVYIGSICVNVAGLVFVCTGVRKLINHKIEQVYSCYIHEKGSIEVSGLMLEKNKTLIPVCSAIQDIARVIGKTEAVNILAKEIEIAEKKAKREGLLNGQNGNN